MLGPVVEGKLPRAEHLPGRTRFPRRLSGHVPLVKRNLVRVLEVGYPLLYFAGIVFAGQTMDEVVVHRCVIYKI
jgi:hypothetical protein